jgi:hypothetical protein
MILSTSAQCAAYVAYTTEELEARLDILRGWLGDRRNPPDEVTVAAIVRALDVTREELERRATLPVPVEPPGPKVQAVGALAAWQAEIRSGVGGQRADRPSTWRFDALHRAACAEAAARDHDREGIHEVGDSYREDAARILATDTREDAA